MDLRNFLFSNRSYTPIPIVLVVLFFAKPSMPYFMWGCVLAFLGESIRINAVRYAGGVTRTIKVGAPSLCTTGPYACTRNPLYLGNMIIYCGIVFIAGGQYMWELFFLVFIFFSFQYSMIISLEEETLNGLFGEDYTIYKRYVPRLFPRLSPWLGKDNRKPTHLFKTLKTEKRTLQNLILIITIIVIKTVLFPPV